MFIETMKKRNTLNERKFSPSGSIVYLTEDTSTTQMTLILIMSIYLNIYYEVNIFSRVGKGICEKY